jgi:hypothetical protein
MSEPGVPQPDDSVGATTIDLRDGRPDEALFDQLRLARSRTFDQAEECSAW